MPINSAYNGQNYSCSLLAVDYEKKKKVRTSEPIILLIKD